MERRRSVWSCEVWRRAVSSSSESFGLVAGVGFGTVGLVIGSIAAAFGSKVCTFTLVSSTKERRSSFCVALLVLKGKPRILLSFCRSTCPSYGPNSVRLLVFPVARINSNSELSIMPFQSDNSCRTSSVSACSLYRRKSAPAECAAPFAESLADCAPPCFRRVV